MRSIIRRRRVHALALFSALFANACSHSGATAAASSALVPPDADRSAILAMLGDYDVNFDFNETVVLRAGYERQPGRRTGGHEAVMLVGLLGGFTTYSSFAFQSLELLASGRTLPALAYIVGTNVLAVAAAWAGLRLCGG